LRTVVEENKEIYQERSRLDEVLSIHDRLEQLESLRKESESESSGSTDAIATRVSVSQAEDLCKEIEGLLVAWQLPEADRVVFSEEAQDIVITGRPRSSDGKGVRAITHSAFTIGLNNFCVRHKLPTSTAMAQD